MADQLQGLLERINREGLEKAEAERQRLVAAAQAEAQALIDKARTETECLVAEARRETDKLRIAGEASLQQAARDVIIALEIELKTALTNIVREDVSQALSPERLADIILELTRAYTATDRQATVQVPEAQMDALQATFTARLANYLQSGIELKPVPDLDAGLRLSWSGDHMVHDFSVEAITELLCAQLNPRLSRIVRQRPA
jgi:V/A-type H+-transporting ATPase subunit E